MRAYHIITCAVWLSACAGSSRTGSAGDVRRVRVCILNDTKSPVRSDLIYRSLEAVGREYARHAGIVLKPVAYRAYHGDLAADPSDQAAYLRRVCPAEAEVKLVFTNRFVTVDEAGPHIVRQKRQLAGGGDPYYGHALFYRAEERDLSQDMGGHSSLATTIKHEIGHVFGLEHETAPRSFMYSPSHDSSGEWTPYIIETLRRNRWQKWFPYR